MAPTRWLDETEQQAWRALLVVINRGLPQLERTLKEHDLLVVQYSILVALSDAPGGTLRLSDLANAANLSPSRLTHRLRSLTERGLVSVSADADDGRGKNAALASAGLRLLQRVAPIHVEDVRGLVFDHLDAGDTEALARALSKVAAELCDHEGFTAGQH